MLIFVLVWLIPITSMATEEKTKVTEIEVESPSTGTYSDGKNINIRAYFNNKITGEVPKLYIKFGSGQIITVSNGVIRNNGTSSEKKQYIEYSYIIQENDNGKLTFVGLSGGKLKDIDGNEVSISLPKISKKIVITAKTEVKSDEPTEKEKTTSKSEKETIETENKKDTKTTSRTSNSTRKKVKTLPYTGMNFEILIAIAFVILSGTFSAIKFKGLKNVK